MNQLLQTKGKLLGVDDPLSLGTAGIGLVEVAGGGHGGHALVLHHHGDVHPQGGQLLIL